MRSCSTCQASTRFNFYRCNGHVHHAPTVLRLLWICPIPGDPANDCSWPSQICVGNWPLGGLSGLSRLSESELDSTKPCLTSSEFVWVLDPPLSKLLSWWPWPQISHEAFKCSPIFVTLSRQPIWDRPVRHDHLFQDFPILISASNSC